MTYAEWIEANVPDDGYGACDRITRAMVKAFPELRRACGFYYDPFWGRRQHWWCVDPEGKVVDPTAAQFPSKGRCEYDEIDPNDPKDRAKVPTGVCMDCGEDVYNGDTFCSSACEAATMADMGLVLDQERGCWRNP